MRSRDHEPRGCGGPDSQRFRAIVTRRRRTRARRVRSFHRRSRVPPGLRVLAQTKSACAQERPHWHGPGFGRRMPSGARHRVGLVCLRGSRDSRDNGMRVEPYLAQRPGGGWSAALGRLATWRRNQAGQRHRFTLKTPASQRPPAPIEPRCSSTFESSRAFGGTSISRLRRARHSRLAPMR